MKTIFIAPILLLIIFGFTYNTWKITLTVSEPDAEIFMNGSKLGVSPQILKITNKSCVEVEVKKAGFLTQKITYCIGKKGIQEPQKNELITMIKDEAYNASSSSEIANIDIGITTSKPEEKAWKLLNEIVTTYFDVLEVTDKSAGYIRTSWTVQSFNGSTIRTRIIIKSSSSDDGVIKYKAKIQSETCDTPGTSAQDDEKFKPWDRILKKYDNLIPELQSRLK